MSPYQHGEVYVTEDGAETDLDLGHYERFASITCSKSEQFLPPVGSIAMLSPGNVKAVIWAGTVQVIPHITDEIKASILALDGPRRRYRPQ